MKSTGARKQKPQNRNRAPQPRRPPGSVPFPQARGKTLEDVYLTTDADFNGITLRFDDKTELVVDIEPCFTFSADYSDWKTGNERLVKRWPRVRSAP